MITAAAFLLPTLPGCSPAASVYKTSVSPEKFISVPELLFLKSGDVQIIRPEGWIYDIALQKKDDGKFFALLLRCTHMDNQLSQDSGGYICHLHGSRFNTNGEVIKGPAERNLESLPAAPDGKGNIQINVKNI